MGTSVLLSGCCAWRACLLLECALQFHGHGASPLRGDLVSTGTRRRWVTSFRGQSCCRLSMRLPLAELPNSVGAGRLCRSSIGMCSACRGRLPVAGHESTAMGGVRVVCLGSARDAVAVEHRVL